MSQQLRESSLDWPGELARAERLQYLDVSPIADLDQFDRGKRWTRWAARGLGLLAIAVIIGEFWLLWAELPS